MSELPNGSVTSVAASAEDAASSAILKLLNKPVTLEGLQAGTELAATPAENGNRKTVRLLLFQVGVEVAAMPAKVLRRVTPATRARRIPHRTNGILRGVCNIRGELVLCADLHRLLGLPARENSDASGSDGSGLRRMVVMGPPDNSWAFEVDALHGIENIDPLVIREPPLTVEYSIGEFTHGVADINGRCVTILDGDRVLAGFKAGLA